MRIDFPVRSHLQSNGLLDSCHSGLRLQCAAISTRQNLEKLTKNGQTPFAPRADGNGNVIASVDAAAKPKGSGRFLLVLG